MVKLLTQMKTCERCHHWEYATTLEDCDKSIGFCPIFQRQKYNDEGDDCVKFEECLNDSDHDNQ